MPQVLKEEVRLRILEAARETFAERGFEGASMAAIGERAGLGTATTYRYFSGKLELFEAAVPADLARRFDALVDRRVAALASATFGPGQAGDDGGEEMLAFWIAHRLEVVILLDRAEGTPHARHGEAFVARLVAATLAELRRREPDLVVRRPARFVLERIFEATRRTLAAILAAHADERALREAIQAFWSYQVAGLEGFARGLSARASR